jgi:hypothetical protein
LCQHLSFLGREIDKAVGPELPETTPWYTLVVCELGPRLRSPAPVLARLPENAHVVLAIPRLDVRWAAYYMQDPRIGHLMRSPIDPAELRPIVEKLASGAIFGLEAYLPGDLDIQYRRVRSFRERCETLEEIESYARGERLRSSLRRAAGQIAEELLMNAMYQAPVDKQGHRVFAEVDPRQRVRRKTPKPVSVRFAAYNGALYISVRDRFDSFRREDLANCLLRCSTQKVQMEDKKLGAGLGLYLIASTTARLIVNILPGRVSEFIAVLDPLAEGPTLKVLSVTTQRPLLESSSHQGLTAAELEAGGEAQMSL